MASWQCMRIHIAWTQLALPPSTLIIYVTTAAEVQTVSSLLWADSLTGLPDARDHAVRGRCHVTSSVDADLGLDSEAAVLRVCHTSLAYDWVIWAEHVATVELQAWRSGVYLQADACLWRADCHCMPWPV